MATLKAKVMRGGRVEVVDRVDYPEGTELEIEVLEPEDDLDAEELGRLDEAVARSRADIAAGRTTTSEELLRRLRSAR